MIYKDLLMRNNRLKIVCVGARDFDAEQLPRHRALGALNDYLAIDLGCIGLASGHGMVALHQIDEDIHFSTDFGLEAGSADRGLLLHKPRHTFLLDLFRNRIGQGVRCGTLDGGVGKTPDAIELGGIEKLQ